MIYLSDDPPRSEGLSFLVSCLLSIVPGCVSRNAWVISVAADTCTTMTAYEAETTTAVLPLVAVPPNLLVLELEGLEPTHLRFRLLIAHHVPEDMNSSQKFVAKSFYRTPFAWLHQTSPHGYFTLPFV